jgi:hypothetical protein
MHIGGTCTHTALCGSVEGMFASPETVIFGGKQRRCCWVLKEIPDVARSVFPDVAGFKLKAALSIF